MNTTALAAAYQRLLTAAQALTPDSPLEPRLRADVDWTLCHVALSDQILTKAARQLLVGRTSATPALVVDNQPAMDPAAIAAMTASTTHRDRADAVRQHAAELIAQLDQIPADDAARTSLTLRFHDRTGQHISDTEMTWTELIRLRTCQHIPAHADRLRSYSRSPAQ